MAGPKGTPMEVRWRIRLFDGPVLESATGQELRRFRSQRIGALLAYLALRLGRAVPREELCEALWPDEDPEPVANRLRVALSSLRKQLEPPGVPFGTVLDASEAGRLRLRADSVWCDVLAFEQALRQNQREQAARLYQGALLPGYWDEWVLTERERLAALREDLPEVAPECPAAPALPTEPTELSTLPLYLTRFFGREAECQHLETLLAENRLVTVVGMGGMGKTRLVVEFARQQVRPVVFVPLAELPDPTRLTEAILAAMGIAARTEATPETVLVAALQRTHPLVILDNAEHVLEAVAAKVLTLLHAVPALTILVTSRQRLDLPGEATLLLEPLDPPTLPATPERLDEFPAVSLFVDRARLARPDFVLTARHADALVTICQRLEGMPLALELAAARVIAQTPTQIAASLRESVLELKSRQRGLEPRHRSLRAAIAGSLALLSPDQRTCFATLSVFPTGWTAEAATAVAAGGSVAETLVDLVSASLVRVADDPERDGLRYSLLEVLRQAAAELLTPDTGAAARQRHATYFLRLAAQAYGDHKALLQRLDGEQENILQALEWGWQHQKSLFWEGLAGWLVFAFVRGHHRIATHWAERALPVLDTCPDPLLRRKVRHALLGIWQDTGRYAEVQVLAAAMEADACAHDDRIGVVLAQTHRGYAANNTGAFAQAAATQSQALEQARAIGDRDLLWRTLSLTMRAVQGAATVPELSPDEAQRLLYQAESLGRELLAQVPATSRFAPLGHLFLALNLALQRRNDDAYAELKWAQQGALEHRAMAILMYGLLYESSMELHFGEGRAPRAALFFGAFQALRERMGYDMTLGTDDIRLAERLLREALGEVAYTQWVGRGRLIPLEELVTQRTNSALIAAYTATGSPSLTAKHKEGIASQRPEPEPHG